MSEEFDKEFEKYNPLIAEYIGFQTRANRLSESTESEMVYFIFDENDVTKYTTISVSDWKPHKKYHQVFKAINKIKANGFFVTIFISDEFSSCEIWDRDRKKQICLHKYDEIIPAVYNAVVDFILFIQKETNHGNEENDA